MTQDAYDLVLFGYRNDVARERVLEYLAALLPTAEGPPPIDRSTPVPQCLFTRLSQRRSQALRQDLERLGAQIKVVAVSGPVPTIRTAPATPQFRPLTAVLLLLLAASVVLKLTIPVPSSPPRSRPARRGKPVDLQIPHIAAAPREAPLRVLGEQQPKDPTALRLNDEAVALAADGQYETAAERLREALRLAPDQSVVRHNLQTILRNWAIRDLQADHPSDAAERLNEALTFNERGDLHQALGMVYLRSGAYDQAREELERAIAAGINDPDTLLGLAEVYLYLNDRTHALETYQRARDAGTSGPQLDELLDRLRREVEAERDFTGLQSPHFHVTFAEGENRSAARVVLSHLEDARAIVGQKIDYFSERTTEVVLYAERDFHDITQQPDWAQGLYNGRIAVPIRGFEENDQKLAAVLRHEYMHSVVGELSDNRCPGWLNEGLARWAEEEQDGEQRETAEHVVRGEPLFRLAELSGSFGSMELPRARVAYAESYLAVRELLDRYGTRKLEEFVSALRRQPVAAAFEEIYYEPLADFEGRLFHAIGT